VEDWVVDAALFALVTAADNTVSADQSCHAVSSRSARPVRPERRHCNHKIND
jgi:hypothetical protein